MVRREPRRKPLGTIWEISDELWRRIEPILLEFWPKKPTGRKVANWRKMPDPTGLQVLKKCRVSGRRHFCHPTSFQGRGCENGRSTEDPASGS